MKSKLALAGVLVFLYLFFVVALIPANVAVGWFSLPKALKLGEVKGSVWQSEVSSLSFNQFDVQNITASVNPWSLLLLSPSADITFGERLMSGPQGKAYVTLTANELMLSDTTINIAAGEIVPFIPLPIPVEAFGGVVLDIKQLSITSNECIHASGTIHWRRSAVMALEQNIEFGDLKASIRCQNKMLALEIDPKNRLGLTYTALLSLGGKVSGQGYLKPGSDFPTALKQALPFLGNADAQGRYPLKF
ncbi:type II secretion system protein N [Thalassotalea sp. M1531]|uniref:Type II secretion system protein N n=1 Tax=Thalassotalea algicola TaxID=2716224 RepID=A0A7Y0Q647_9GAMM|nr:type II secretion system protein N [Thalassotalea algicola]NMP30422.1 type II secretion system protein N [Thalassotalea algicola]